MDQTQQAESTPVVPDADLVDDVDDDMDDDGEDITEPVQITPDGGVIKKIINPGKGFAKPPKGADVRVHYVGTLEDGSKFDSSRDRDQPFEFKLGEGRVIKGWDLGVATMKKGEKSVFTIKSDYGYGASGSPPKIPGGATLIFEVELLTWIDFTDLTKDGGVTKKVLKEAESGDWEKPKEDATATIKYTVKDESGKVVEENVEKKFVIGAEEVSRGLEIGVKDMKKGEKALLTLRADYTTVDTTSSTDKKGLVYEVELVDFTKEKEAWEMETAEKFSTCEKVKAEGNELFKVQKWERAKKKYKKALDFVDSDYAMEEADKEKAQPYKLACQLNIAACDLKLKNWKAVIESCKKALDIKPDVKAYFRRGQAYNGLDEWELAEADFKRVLELDADNKEAKREMAVLARKKQEQDRKDRRLYSQMFK